MDVLLQWLYNEFYLIPWNSCEDLLNTKGCQQRSLKIHAGYYKKKARGYETFNSVNKNHIPF